MGRDSGCALIWWEITPLIQQQIAGTDLSAVALADDLEDARRGKPKPPAVACAFAIHADPPLRRLRLRDFPL